MKFLITLLAVLLGIILSACGPSTVSGSEIRVMTPYGAVENPQTEISSQFAGGHYELHCSVDGEQWFWASEGTYGEFQTHLAFAPNTQEIFASLSRDGVEYASHYVNSSGLVNSFTGNETDSIFRQYIESLDVPSLISSLAVEQEETHKNFSCLRP